MRTEPTNPPAAHAEPDGPRPLRADAQHNYERLVSAAAAAFAVHGDDASLKAIAEAAGVGIGTLYRRFGTREELIAAVNRNRILEVCDQADALRETADDPALALHSAMVAIADFLVDRHGVATALIPTPGEPTEFRATIRGRLITTVSGLLTLAQASGQVREDADAADLLRLLGGAAFAAESPGQAHRFVDLIADGLRA